MTTQPTESKDYPGFYEIPNFSRYVINQDGVVINRLTDCKLKGSVNPAGYHNFRITHDNGKCYTWGRHRLLGYVFKHPGVPIDKLVVNHLRGVKGQDDLEYLEWTTHQGNLEHAGRTGLTSKCIPVSVRDTITGEVTVYPSATACGKALGFSKDAILYRLKIGETRVFPEHKQYRESVSDEPWYAPENIKHALAENAGFKTVLMKNVLTGEVTEFKYLTDLAAHLGKSLPAVSNWINDPNQSLYPGFVQLKWSCDPRDWRPIKDPYLEYDLFTGRRTVKITNDKTGEERLYVRAVDCAKEMELSPTALNYRLSSKGSKVYSDGWRYSYYVDTL